MSRIAGLQRLLRPRHVAVIGGVEAQEVIRQCEMMNYAGQLWPVSPKRATMGEKLGDKKCFASVDDLPKAPDAAFIAVPREATISYIHELAQSGAGGGVCFAAGFAEMGEEGARLQEQLVEAAGDMAIVGPNCYGVLNYLDGVALFPDNHGGHVVDRGVAIVTQSGNMGVSMTMQQRSLPLAYMISVGNQACLGMHDYIDALCEDDRVSAIGLHIEGIPDVIAFCGAAIKALRKGVPIVGLATGRSELGRKTTVSHTSSLAASSDIMDALFERLGIARVNTLSEFLETLKLLSVNGELPGSKIATISCSGGEAALTADLANTLGLEMPPLNDKQRQDLENVLGERVLLSNPLDYHTYIWGDGDAQKRCFAAMAQGEQDITLKIIDFPHEDTLGHWKQAVEAFVAAVTQTKSRGAVVSTLPETLPQDTREYLVKRGVAPMQGLEECLVAVQAAALIGRRQQIVDEIQTVLNTELCHGSETVLDEWQSKQLLQQYGLPIPRGELVTQQNASTIAEDIGFPVVMKAVGENIQHKSELDAIKLNLKSAQEVSNAVVDLSQHSEQFLLEQMIDDAVAELIIGITRHNQFGLALVIGSGGVLTELVQDAVTLLLPITEYEVVAALRQLRVMQLLQGYRGKPAGDIDACIAAIMSIVNFTQEKSDCLLELDVNPLMVLPEGQGVVAADALIRMVQK